jgi:ammonia channel protein AmtB
LVIGLRVTEHNEVEGLDTSLHEESGYRLWKLYDIIYDT